MGTVICNYCGANAKLEMGSTLFAHRPELAHKRIWRCDPCDAQVGTHPHTHEPMGKLAKPALRKLRMEVHAVFDPLWRTQKKMTRTKAYEWLAGALGIPIDECHVGLFDEEMCARALKALDAAEWA